MKKILLMVLLSVASAAQANPIVKWYYTDWIIDNSTVCYNYTKNTVEWRECRRYASLYFREQCGVYSRSSDLNRRKMFCTAASSYSPL